MNNPLTVTLFVIFVCALPACKDDGPQPPDFPQRIKLTLIDVAVHEAYLHVAVSNPANNETLILLRNGTPVMTFAAVADTNIADTALTQTTSYQYTATVQTSSTTGKSNIISAQTLAPTSHNFTWQTFLLGDGNNSSLSDVAIINDSLIYAVGEMYVRDSSGAIGDTPYNLARWNGLTWDMKRIKFVGPCSAVDYPPLKAICAFAANDIIVTNGGSIVHYDGTNSVMDCRMNSLLTGAMNRIYAFNRDKVYVVGGGGDIVHYNGTIWQRIESGTTTEINDAWGVVNPITGKEEVYCPTSSFFTSGDRLILKIKDDGRVDIVLWINRLLDATWSNQGYPLFAAGDGVFENASGQWQEHNTGASIFTNKIRGTALNNIIAVGDLGFITHFNGVDWHMVGYDYDAGYASVAVKGNTVIAVGRKGASAFVNIGRRQ